MTQMMHPHIMKDFSEVVHYNCSALPVYIQNDDLSRYLNMSAPCHWHKDIEIIYILDGEMNYHINDKIVPIKKNECVIINSLQLHYGSSIYHHACRFICIRFHPKILGTDPSVYQTYVTPLIENPRIDYLYYDSNSQNHPEVEALIDRMTLAKAEMCDACELDIISSLHLLWRILYLQCRPVLGQEAATDDTSLDLQKKMVSYIYEHYQEPLTLDEIAASASISRSKCCIVFKQYLQQSPIDFLNRHRLEMSGRLLLNTQASITEIALSCGFNHLSYFSKMFLREYGCTPTEYRKNTNKEKGTEKSTDA